MTTKAEQRFTAEEWEWMTYVKDLKDDAQAHNDKEFKSIEDNGEDPILYIRDLKKTNDFSLWLGCENGLFLYDIEKQVFNRFKDDRLTGIYEIEYLEEENKLLVASFNSGLLVFDLANNVVEKQFVHKDSDSLSLSNNSLMCITRLDKGIYCLGTFGGGFSVFDYKKETFSKEITKHFKRRY